jgi:hypothetical protein
MAIASQAALQRPAGHRNNLAGDAGDGWRGKVDYGTGDIFALGSAVIAGTGNFSQTGMLGNLIGRLSPALLTHQDTHHGQILQQAVGQRGDRPRHVRLSFRKAGRV